MSRWVVGIMTALVLTAGCGGSGSEPTMKPSATGVDAHTAAQPDPAATGFLERYVEKSGRVVRRDQGGDVVSEGQAYAMLIAQLAGRNDVVRAVWGWTREHLQRSDALLAFHADSSGHVLDHQSAADADVLAAYALLRYDGLEDTKLHADGRRLADAVLAHETVAGAGGKPVLVAGPWAVGDEPTVNPSYWMPGVFSQLARLTDDSRWQAVAESSVQLVATVTDQGGRLPPDWARLRNGGIEPIAAPGGGAGVQYGLDAMRAPIWFAKGCSEAAHDLAAAWWRQRLSKAGNDGALALDLDGGVVKHAANPLPYVAAAAAADAAGASSERDALMVKAAEQANKTPTYYGDAWVALGAGLLRGAFADCAA
jgi:endoglucanase